MLDVFAALKVAPYLLDDVPVGQDPVSIGSEKAIALCNLGFYLTYVGPDVMGSISQLQDEKWWAIMNTGVTVLMVGKTAADSGITFRPPANMDKEAWNKASAWLEMCGNIVWQIPVIGAIVDPDNHNAVGTLNFVGNTCFDLNGWLAPAMYYVVKARNPVGIVAVGAVQLVANLVYGATSVAAAA